MFKEHYDKETRKFQDVLDELKKFPEFRQYIKAHSLSLLDDKFKIIDILLDAGIIK